MKCRRGLAMRILSVCPSVCLSLTRVIPDKMKERSVQIFILYERQFIPVIVVVIRTVLATSRCKHFLFCLIDCKWELSVGGLITGEL